MSRMSRSERIGVMTKILLDQPNRIFTLNYFSELFGVAKSTVSEDVMLLRRALNTFNLGTLETVVGAAGGVKYKPQPGQTGFLILYRIFVKNCPIPSVFCRADFCI